MASESVEPFPGRAMTLTAPHQGMSPCATDFMPKAFKPFQVTVYCIVIEVSL
jgi:hypothetical protein